MAISMARSHRDWCKKVSGESVHSVLYSDSFEQNLEHWEEAKNEIAKIPNHPNRLPEDAAPTSPVTNGRRDSTATINGR